MLFAIIFITFLSCGGNAKMNENETERNQKLEDTAKTFVTLLTEGKYKEARAYFNTQMAQALSTNQLKQLWENDIKSKYGEFEKIISTRSEEMTSQGQKYLVVYVKCKTVESNYFNMRVILDKNNEIAGLWHEKASKPDETDKESEDTTGYTKPDYADESSFKEEQITIDGLADREDYEKCELPGLLTLPNTEGPYPAVVLIHGSGANDMDETIGPNKPFKDLAWGLATKGIAVLRYDKRTKHCTIAKENLDDFTVNEETVYDALYAVKLLRNDSRIKKDSIYVIGHSLGGYIAPRIGKMDKDINGLIIMAGNSGDFLDLILTQYKYLAELDGTITEEEQKQIDAVKNAVEKIRSGEIKEGEFLLGAGKAYWEDLLSYKPVETAKSLEMPFLILQGERDYQVTMEEFEGWKEGLKGKDNVDFISYPKLNHLFMPGEGQPNPQEYANPSHIPEKVITDIKEWLAK